MVITLGVFLVWIPVYMVALGLLAFISGSIGELPSWVYMLSALAGIGGVVYFIYRQGTKPYRMARRKNPLRLGRLKKIFDHPEGGRLPHRLVELMLRRRKGSSGHFERILKRCRPYSVIAILPNQRLRLPFWKKSNYYFEPIELNGDADELLDYVNGELELVEEVEEENPKRKILSLQRVKSLTFSALFYGFFFWFFASLIYQLRNSLTAWLWVLGLIGIMIVVPILLRLIIDKKWWIFPGGLIRRVDAFGRDSVVHIFGPDSTPLIIDFRNEYVAVTDGGRIFTLSVEHQTQWGVLAAWTSSARRPTKEELLSFLGIA